MYHLRPVGCRVVCIRGRRFEKYCIDIAAVFFSFQRLFKISEELFLEFLRSYVRLDSTHKNECFGDTIINLWYILVTYKNY